MRSRLKSDLLLFDVCLFEKNDVDACGLIRGVHGGCAKDIPLIYVVVTAPNVS